MHTSSPSRQTLTILLFLSTNFTALITALPTPESSQPEDQGVRIFIPTTEPERPESDPNYKKQGGIIINPIDPKPSTDPYAQGICTLKLTSSSTPNTVANGEYNIAAQLFDDASQPISLANASPVLSSPQNLLFVKSKLEDVLKITPLGKEFGNAFELGQQKWDTGMRDEGSVPWCGAFRDLKTEGGKVVEKEVECKFVCHWGGGLSSDGRG